LQKRQPREKDSWIGDREEIGGGIMVNFREEIVGGIRVDFPFKVRSRIFRWIWGLKSMYLFGQRWWDGINYLIGDRVDIRDDGVKDGFKKGLGSS
jgi:hypothetical protein